MFIQRIQQHVILLKNMIQCIFSSFIPKNNNIWVFGAIRGKKYMDNAKYIFEYVHENTNITAIWISKNNDIINELNNKGFNAYHENSQKGKYFARRAKIAIVTHRGNRNNSDLPFQLFSKKTKIIQLWHGIPLKKIAFDDKIFSNKFNENSIRFKIITYIKKIFFPFLNYVHQPSLILALSKETKDIFSKAFRVDKNIVKITGYPRSDILLKKISFELDMNKKQKIIYMPTFRGSVDSNFDLFLQFGFDVHKLDTFLGRKNMSLDIKLHPFNQPSNELIQQLKNSCNISFLQYDAIYEIINSYDILITDYSSIYFDYLLLDKPIIFTPFDKDDYMKKDREFYFDYDKVTPGPKVLNWDEVIFQLENIENFNKMYSTQRNTLKNKFHYYQDTNNTKRVFEAIKAIANS
jgi:CDP-glycerol glycerophosphotransferase